MYIPLRPHASNQPALPGTAAILLLAGLLFFAASPQAHGALVDQLKDRQSSLRCDNIKVALLLSAIGRQAGVNIFVDDDIKDSITMDLEGLTLYEAFQLVLDAKGLTYTEKNNVLLVQKLSGMESGIKNLRTRRLCTEFGNAGAYIEQLNSLLSPHGKLTVSNRGDCLIAQDLALHLDRVAALLAELDQPIPQVHIEAKIVSVSNEAQKRLGIRWDYDNLATKDTLAGTSDLGVLHTTNLAIGFIRDNLTLGIDLQAMQEDNMLKILSSPRVLVLDGKEAEIKSGKEVPYVTQSGDNINTTFREANLSLKVTPQIIKNNYVVLDVVVTNDSVDQSGALDDGPLINKQGISTKLYLENSVTVVIGGILLESEDNQKSRVPVLSHIPLIGWLFTNSEKVKERSELLVFITPTIVKMAAFEAKASGGPVRVGDVSEGPPPVPQGPAVSSAPQESTQNKP